MHFKNIANSHRKINFCEEAKLIQKSSCHFTKVLGKIKTIDKWTFLKNPRISTKIRTWIL